MRFDILTIFPDFFSATLRSSIVGRALESGQLDCHVHNIRDWTTDKHHCTDDAPYGGGGGMVMLAEPLLRAIRDVRAKAAAAIGAEPGRGRPPLIYLSPQGRVLNHALVHELASQPALILLCGNYEGIDERVAELEVDGEISVGDYVLTGGELAALILINSVARQVEGVLGNPDSARNDSFENGLLDFPHYTRPEVVEGQAIPEVLKSGHHAKIERWRRDQSLRRTFERRPELLQHVDLDKADRALLRELGYPLPPEPPDEKRRRKKRATQPEE